jgi:hypothetical protein
MSFNIYGWTDNGDKQIEITNREGDIWPHVTYKALSSVTLRLGTSILQMNFTSNTIITLKTT